MGARLERHISIFVGIFNYFYNFLGYYSLCKDTFTQLQQNNEKDLSILQKKNFGHKVQLFDI